MPNFFGGLAEGLQGLPQEIGQLQEIARARKVAQALDNTYAGAPSPAPGGGAPPAPAPHPLAALAGVGKPPQAGPAPAPRDPLAPLPAAPPPQAPPAPPPGAPTGQPGAEAPTGMAVNPTLADPVKEGQSIIKNLWQTIKAKNPKADPYTIMKAVDSQIDEIKGVAPITKATMQGQLQLLGFNLKSQQFQIKESDENARFAMKMQDLVTHHASQDQIAQENERHRAAMVSIAQQRADAYGESVTYQHEDRQASTNARITVANINGKFRLQGIDAQQSGAGQRAQAALDGKHGASVAAGLAKFLAVNPGADASQLDSVTDALETAYTHHSGGGTPSGGSGGGIIPSEVQQFAKKNGLTIVRRRADGKYDARAKDGTVGVIG